MTLFTVPLLLLNGYEKIAKGFAGLYVTEKILETVGDSVSYVTSTCIVWYVTNFISSVDFSQL